MAKSLETIELKIKALQNEKKAILKKENDKKRKVRTKRLIERGAMIEKYFGIDDTFSNAQFNELLQKLISSKDFSKLLNNLKTIIGKDTNI